MPVYPPDQKIPNVNRKGFPSSKQKTPRAKLKPATQKTSQGDLGILPINNPGIPRMVKAPTRDGDARTNDVTMKMRSVMKRSGMLG